MSRQPLSPDAPRGTKSDRHKIESAGAVQDGAASPAADIGQAKAAEADASAASGVTETPPPVSPERAGSLPPRRKPGPPPGLVAQLMLGFAVLAAAAGTYLVLKLPKAAPQSDAVRSVPAATGVVGTNPSRDRPPR